MYFKAEDIKKTILQATDFIAMQLRDMSPTVTSDEMYELINLTIELTDKLTDVSIKLEVEEKAERIAMEKVAETLLSLSQADTVIAEENDDVSAFMVEDEKEEEDKM